MNTEIKIIATSAKWGGWRMNEHLYYMTERAYGCAKDAKN